MSKIEQNREIDLIEDYQKQQLYGFTTRELADLDALCIRDILPGNLQNDIIPLFDRPSWELSPAQPAFTRKFLYPFADGSGYWTAHNDEMWRILEPVVRLASRMLMLSYLLPWFDALLNGPRREIPHYRLLTNDLEEHKKNPYLSFEWDRNHIIEELHTKYDYNLGFMIETEHLAAPYQDAPGDALGLTFTNNDEMLYERTPSFQWRIFGFLNTRHFEIVRSARLNSSERMNVQWLAASTMVHKAIHAIYTAIALDTTGGIADEIFFEDKAMVELGFAFEFARLTASQESLIENYLLLVRMTCSDDPVITRLLSVPSDLTFAKLHHVLQAAFGWAGCHAYSFSVSKLLEEGQQSFTGRGKEILTLMWDDDMKDAYPDPDQIKKDSDYTLADIYDSDEYKGKIEVSYEYDHGDSWDHEISFLGRADPAMRRAMHIPDDLQVVCLAGEGHPCAEDAGGAGGWEDLKKTFKRRNDPEGRKDWYKYSCANGDPKGLDPYKWDILDVNDALSQIKA
ncbi:hypothetical protein G7Y89_g8843 [Cudoniella acicularis]|uniref:Plasmid pRiA4b Orf3-like domain-containing protein n=1 Tax=Cudoniella acicularis TaxID=354080 RepID=A0A8H4W2I2_9HELO|nr:hypothetical protein G7Y89_g8843 [Cudoniella acicularis]